MPRVLDPFRFVVIAVAGWMNQRQLQIIDYLREENRVLREQLSDKRLRLNDDPAPKIGREGQGVRTEDPGGGGHDCHARDLARLAHYHAERNHQGLANRIISPEGGILVIAAQSGGDSAWAAC